MGDFYYQLQNQRKGSIFDGRVKLGYILLIQIIVLAKKSASNIHTAPIIVADKFD